MANSGFSGRDVFTGRTLFEPFKEDLVRELNKHTIGLDYKHHFLPASSRRALVTCERLRLLLPSSDEHHIQWLLENASITFAITLLSLNGYQELVDALDCFSHHQFDDSCLPILDLTAAQAEELCKCNGAAEEGKPSDRSTRPGFGSTRYVLPCHHERTRKAFSPAYWGLLSKKRFFNDQWSFIPQCFDMATFEYNLENQRLLPFIVEDDDKRQSGGFGDVMHARIHKEYLLEREEISGPLELQSDPDRHIQVAIKTLHPRSETYYDIESEWKREVHAHRTLNAIHHQNIVKGLGAFRQGQKFNLILEWASGGSLTDFWAENPEPQLTASKVLELLEQMRGLADALNSLHNTVKFRTRIREGLPSIRVESEQQPSLADDVSTPTPLIILPPDNHALPIDDVTRSPRQEENAMNWRHGDIKPANILIFKSDKSDKSWLGTFKLADFGRAKFHQNVTRLRPSVEIDYWHTMKYEPPDLFVNRGARSQSRLSDIWSLGCVFLELVVWLLHGTKGLREYEATTETTMSEGTPYWNRVGTKGAVVSQSASLLMNMMRKHPSCRDDSALGDVVKLIQNKMLVVVLPADTDWPVQEFRCNADVVSMELTRIVTRAKAERFYLFSGALSLDTITGAIQSADDSETEPVLKRPVLTELRVTSPRQEYHKGHHERKLRKSKSYTGPITRRQLHSIADENTALTMPKLNHITLVRSNMTTQFSYSLRDTWHYEDDDIFAEKTLRMICGGGKFLARLYPDQDTELCDECAQFDPALPASFKTRSLSSLRRTSEDCNLCEYLSLLADKGSLLSTHEVSLARDGGLMRINNRPDMRMRICRSPGSQRQADIPGNGIPIGLPKLDRAAKSAHLKIIQQWLKDCDNSHDKCAPTWPLGYCPRRLLYLGENDECKLVETQSLGRKRHFLKYAAFSHPWGLPQQHHHFKSTRINCPDFLVAIGLEQLPANYQDAIRVCRAVGIQYLWIDSICILQATDGDAGDFHDEVAFIQDIFGYAYCVIAASSAQGTSSGFLKPRKSSEPLRLQMKFRDGQPGGSYYVSDVLDDFEKDVLDGPLNERGWVMQERALARRTLFFTANQTYFECGRGVRCETLSKLRCDRAAFLGDSNFPDFGMSHKFSAQLYLIAALYERYSALNFTQYTDKSIAISGMELRLTRSFGKRSSAGIFQQHQGRWLLWERAEDVESLVRVRFPDTMIINRPPSWSFMAYIGAITYIIPPSSQIIWNDQIRLTLTGNPSTMWLYTEEKPGLRSRIITFADHDAEKIAEVNKKSRSRAERAQNEVYITFDDPTMATEPIKTFILIGTLKLGGDLGARNYVLAVRPVSESKLVYERVGAGWLPDWLIYTAWEPVPYFPIV